MISRDEDYAIIFSYKKYVGTYMRFVRSVNMVMDAFKETTVIAEISLYVGIRIY